MKKKSVRNMSILNSCNADIPNGFNCIGNSRERSGSRVIIHEKWGRTTPEPHPGVSDVERLRLRDNRAKVRARRITFLIKGCQIISSYSFPRELANQGVLW